jgi:hypothetical protein
MIRDFHPGFGSLIWILIFAHPGSRIRNTGVAVTLLVPNRYYFHKSFETLLTCIDKIEAFLYTGCHSSKSGWQGTRRLSITDH